MAIQEAKTLQLSDNILLDVRPELDYVQLRALEGAHEIKAQIKKVDLWAAVFAIMDGKMQDDLMPVRQTQMMTFERIHMVRVKRDLKKGEVLRFKTKHDIPLTIVESLKGMLPEGKVGEISQPTIHTATGRSG